LVVLTKSRGSGALVVEVAGDLTAATFPVLESHFAALLRHMPAAVVLDLSGAQSCDCTGAMALEATARMVSEAGGHARLVVPDRIVRRLLDRTGTTERVNTFTTVAAAISDTDIS